MKFLKTILCFSLALLAGVAYAEAQPQISAAVDFLMGLPTHGAASVLVATTISLVGLRNIADQTPNPAGGRRLFAVLVADLDDTVVDWPKIGDVTDSAVTVAVPLKTGKTLAVIQPADNSLDGTFESQGDRNYMAWKHGVMFDIAGLSKEQLSEAQKFTNAGAILFVEEHDATVKVYGTKLNPIVLKIKGQLGKKGGDKKGMSFSGDGDSYMFAPPIYPGTLALPLPGSGS